MRLIYCCKNPYYNCIVKKIYDFWSRFKMKSKSYCSSNSVIVVSQQIEENCGFFKDNNFLHLRIT